MATENLQIPDILANQNSKEVTANAAHNLLDRAINNNVSIAMSAGINNLTTTQARENFVIELTGTPGSAFTLEMPDTNKRTLAVVNNSDDVCTVQNPSAGGTGQPVIAVGEASIFHFDGTDFFDLSALALAVASWISLTDTPGAYTGESGRFPQVNDAETALEFIGTAAKRNVIAATTTDSALASTFENGDAIDSVTLVTGDRILIKDQTLGEENGIYRVEASGAPTRVEDFDDALDMQESPVMVPVLEGAANAGTVWIHTTAGAITVDTTPLTFVQLLDPGTFTALTDAPSSYTNFGGQQVTVNEAENAVEFTAQHAKVPVRLATAVAGTLSTDFENTDSIDGVALVTGDRILIKDQSAGSENGVYVVEATGAPTRAIDFDDNADVILGETVPVLLGDTNARSVWMHTAGTDIGTDTLTFLKVEPAVGYMPLLLGSLRLLSTDEIAGLLDNTTTPSFERINGATDKGLRVLWGLSNNDEIAFPEVYMPPDFDSDKDITVHIVGEMSGATDTPTIDVLVFDSSGDTEMGGVTATFTDTRAEKTVTISAADITGHPLGWLSISLLPVGAHATDTLAIFSCWIEYTRKAA